MMLRIQPPLCEQRFMTSLRRSTGVGYSDLVEDLAGLLESARRTAARTVNAVMTATYWEMGRRLVEFEQSGAARAEYGQKLIVHLSADLTKRFGRGFGPVNLSQMKKFYLVWPAERILQTVSEESAAGSPAARLPLPWSHYVRLMSVKNSLAREFYEAGALRGGWSVRQLDRQIASQFYERTALSKNKTSMLIRGSQPKPDDRLSADEEVRDPFILEFLGLKEECSETHLEEALVRHLEAFLLELGGPLRSEGLPSKVLAREYRLVLPDEKRLAAEIEKTRQHLEAGRTNTRRPIG